MDVFTRIDRRHVLLYPIHGRHFHRPLSHVSTFRRHGAVVSNTHVFLRFLIWTLSHVSTDAVHIWRHPRPLLSRRRLFGNGTAPSRVLSRLIRVKVSINIHSYLKRRRRAVNGGRRRCVDGGCRCHNSGTAIHTTARPVPLTYTFWKYIKLKI